MDALDMLLGDEDLLKKPEKQFIVKRLSKTNVNFILNLQAISMNTFKHIQDINTNKKDTLDAIGTQVSMLCYGVKEFNMKNAENKVKLEGTFKKVNVNNIEEFISRILLPGEIANIAEEISNLSGFDGDTIEEIKNE